MATLMAFVTAAPAAAIGQTCIDDGPPDRIKTLCIAAPEDGAVVAGEISVTGTVDPVNDPRTQKVEFYLDGDYLLTEFQSSSSSRAIFDFELPTTGWVDGLHRLEMLAITRIDGDLPSYTTARVGIDLDFDNGITVVSPKTTTFTPTTGRATGPGETFTVAAVGDGASGELDAAAVSDMIVNKDPNLFLYLGDVYEKGTITEFYNYYGGADRLWGRLRSITNPTISNHEYTDGQAPGYFDYWDNIDNFYSFDSAGWHFVSLNSTNAFRNSPEQFNWLLNDIASNTEQCTIVYWADPRFTIGTQGDEVEIDEEWRALVDAGADIFLAANDHNYQRWEPLNAAGQLDPSGAVSFVVGTGGHGIRPFAPDQSEANPRVARGIDQLDVGGALFLDLGQDSANFRFVEADGTIRDSGTIPCRPNPTRTYRATLSAIAAEWDITERKAAEKLHEALVEEKRWTADGGLTDSDGKEVFDRMKKAVEELNDASADPVVELAERMARDRIDRALAAAGDSQKITEAELHLAKALQKLNDGEPNKAIGEYKKAWEKARDAGGVADLSGFTAELIGQRNELSLLSSTLNGSSQDKVESAVNELDKVLIDHQFWDAAGRPSDSDGKDVFDKIKKAIEKLRGVSGVDAVDHGITQLVSLSSTMAQDRIERAVADSGDPKKIAEANEHMAKAVQKLSNGEPHKAADEYKKAWEKARDA